MKPRIRPVLSMCVSVLMLAACAGTGEQTAQGEVPGKGMQARLDPVEIARTVKAAMDPTADPCQDFYQYACGGWLATTEIPSDQSQWGRGFDEIIQRNREVLREILEEAGRDAGAGAEAKRLGDFYKACMDEEAVESAGAKPLEPLLEEVSKIAGLRSLMALTGKLHRAGGAPIFEVAVYPDFKDPGVNIAHFGQGGLGLPDRDYYLEEDDRRRELRAAYTGHVAKMLELSGETAEEASRQADRILAFETDLARISWPRQELRDPEKTYNRLDLDGLKKLTPEIPWDAYLEATGYPGVREINVQTPSFFEGLRKVLRGTDPAVLRSYMRWHLVTSVAGLLNSDFVNENFEFYGKRLQGQQEIQPRWKRCVAATDAALGESLGRLFVDRQFAGDSKEKALEMIRNVEHAFQQNLPELAWMDASTRERAVQKMSAVFNKIGYPDSWRDYSALAIRPGQYFENSLAARDFEFRRNADKVGKGVDKAEWFMSPPTVNAYYNPLFNEMVFPAGIMQRPFFHRDFPAAMNYGGMGMVMGHELTHGFDDQGRKFDSQGRMTQWWEPEAVEKFEEATSCIRDQYASYEVLPGLNLNGELTLGENIADLGGIKEAYHGYKKWERDHEVPEPAVEGLTNDQLFFVGYAQTWCNLATEEIERMLVTVDPHSPPRFRVNGPLSNFPVFAQAFGCEPGTPMRPEAICQVW